MKQTNRRVDFSDCKTYKTHANAVKAAESFMGKMHQGSLAKFKVRYIIHATEDGRFTPVFLGEGAASLGIHFHYPVMN